MTVNREALESRSGAGGEHWGIPRLAKRGRDMDRRTIASFIYPYLYIVPALVVFLAFLAYPYYFAIRLSFYSWDGLSPMDAMKWVGLNNYVEMFADYRMGLVVSNTVTYAIVVTFFMQVISFTLAFGLFYLVSGRLVAVLRTLFFYPVILSHVVVGLAWVDLLRMEGFVNTLVGSIIGSPVALSWLGNPDLALWAIMGVAIWWGVGWNMVLYLAGLTGVPREVLDAAAIDGASTFQLVRHVVIGMIVPVISLTILLTIISNFQTFALIFAATRGGPMHATEVIGTYAYWLAFDRSGPMDMGYASTLSVLMSTFLFAYAFLRIRSSRLV